MPQFLPQSPIPTIHSLTSFSNLIRTIYPYIDPFSTFLGPHRYHITALYRPVTSSSLYTLIINETAPKSSWDFLCLNLARAAADLILTTSQIQQSEPDLDMGILGRPDLVEYLTAFRCELLSRRFSSGKKDNFNTKKIYTNEVKFADVMMSTRLFPLDILSTSGLTELGDEYNDNLMSNIFTQLSSLIAKPHLSLQFCQKHMQRGQNMFIFTHNYIARCIIQLQQFITTIPPPQKYTPQQQIWVDMLQTITQYTEQQYITFKTPPGLFYISSPQLTHTSNNTSQSTTTAYFDIIEATFTFIASQPDRFKAISIESGPNTTNHIYFQHNNTTPAFLEHFIPQNASKLHTSSKTIENNPSENMGFNEGLLPEFILLTVYSDSNQARAQLEENGVLDDPTYNPQLIDPQKNVVLIDLPLSFQKKSAKSSFCSIYGCGDDESSLSDDEIHRDIPFSLNDYMPTLTTKFLDTFYHLTTMPFRPYSVLPTSIINPHNLTAFHIFQEDDYLRENEQYFHDGTIELVPPENLPIFALSPSETALYTEEYSSFVNGQFYTQIRAETYNNIIFPFFDNEGTKDLNLNVNQSDDIKIVINEICNKQDKIQYQISEKSTQTVNWSHVPFSCVKPKLGWTMFLLQRKNLNNSE